MRFRLRQTIFAGPVLRALLVLAVALPAVFFTQFVSIFEVDVRPEGIRLELNRGKVYLPVEVGEATSFTVDAVEPFQHIMGGRLTVTDQHGVRYELQLDRPWRFPASVSAPASDWYVDFSTTSQALGILTVRLSPPYRFTLEVPGRNLERVGVLVGGETPYLASFRRGFLNSDMTVEMLPPLSVQSGTHLRGPLSQDAKEALGPFARALALAAILILSASLVGFGLLRWFRPSTPTTRRVFVVVPLTLVAVLALARFATSVWISHDLLHDQPHFQDDMCYLLRAKWLLAGSLDRPIPAVSEQLKVPFTKYHRGRWITPYPINWPLLLALGMAFGATYLVAPVCGAIAIWFQFQLARRLGGDAVGLGAALLLAVSPICLVLSGSIMNHASNACCLTIFAACFVLGWGGSNPAKPILLGALVASGAALGFAFGIRPLTAAAVGLPTFLLGLWEWRRRQWNGAAFGGLVCFAAAVVLGATPTLLDNAAVTGSPFRFAYQIFGEEVTFSHPYTLAIFEINLAMGQLPGLIAGWGWPYLRNEWWLSLPVGFALVPFVVGRADRYSWWLFGLFAAVVLAHVGHPHGMLHGFGPRHLSDALFALYALAALGCARLATLPVGRALGLRPLRISFALLFVALCGSSVWGLRGRLPRYVNYNNVKPDLAKSVRGIAEARAFLLLPPDSYLQWIELANVLAVDLERAKVIVAESRPDNTALFQAYGVDRAVYLYKDGEIVRQLPASPVEDRPSP